MHSLCDILWFTREQHCSGLRRYGILHDICSLALGRNATAMAEFVLSGCFCFCCKKNNYTEVRCLLLCPERSLRSGVDILVGTPGRIKDLLERGSLDLSQLNHVVLDEVDRMLDMGFADDVDSILTYRYSGCPSIAVVLLLIMLIMINWLWIISWIFSARTVQLWKCCSCLKISQIFCPHKLYWVVACTGTKCKKILKSGCLFLGQYISI